jgi:hypothetical protein
MSRIAVLLEPGRSGAAAVAQVASLGAAEEVTVVAVAPTVNTVCRSCGGVSARAYNCAVRDDVADDLSKAVASLGGATRHVEGRLLVEGTDPPLEAWVVAGGFDLVLLPSRWGVPHSPRHPAARRLRRHTEATIRVVRRSRRGAGMRV